MMGTGPLVSHFSPWVPSVAYCGLSGSSKYRVVPMRGMSGQLPRKQDIQVFRSFSSPLREKTRRARGEQTYQGRGP